MKVAEIKRCDKCPHLIAHSMAKEYPSVNWCKLIPLDPNASSPQITFTHKIPGWCPLQEMSKTKQVSISLNYDSEDECWIAQLTHRPLISAFGDTPAEAVREFAVSLESLTEIEPDWLEDKGEWISVDDKLPREGQKVFLLLKDGDGNVGIFRDRRTYGGTAHFNCGDDIYSTPLDFVTHWQPQPQGPGE